MSWPDAVTNVDQQGAGAELERVGAFKLSDDQLELTLAAAGAVGTWDWDLAGERLYADARFAALHGIERDAAVQGADPAAFFARIHPADRARVRIGVAGILEGAEVFSREYRLVAGDGSTRWVEARGRAQHDPDDRPVRFTGVLVDIT